MRTLSIHVQNDQLADLCRRYGIAELSLFGSVLRDDFGPESDIDVLVSFEPGKTLTLESYTDIREDLSKLFGGRDVDVVEAERLGDPYRRHEILRTREQIYGR